MNQVEWIEVSERPPIEEQIVWVTAFGWAEICIFRCGMFRSLEYGTQTQDVTAWATLVLPDPYQNKDKPNHDLARPNPTARKPKIEMVE